MVVVSSIEPDAITNTYNDGANTLRRFLTYATAISQGDLLAAKATLATYTRGRRPQLSAAALQHQAGAGAFGAEAPAGGRAVSDADEHRAGTGLGGDGGESRADERGARTGLDGSGVASRAGEAGAGGLGGGGVVSRDGEAGADAGPRGAVVEQLRRALEGRGVETETGVGESVFRCDLALKLPGDVGHRVAVLVDTPERIEADSLLERLTTHPRALTATGWRVHHVLTTDWTRSPGTVVDQLLETLHRPVDD
jgi:hypothetical protein